MSPKAPAAKSLAAPPNPENNRSGSDGGARRHQQPRPATGITKLPKLEQPARQVFLRAILSLMLFGSTANVHAAAVDFVLADLSGNPVHLSDFRGKWVVVNYWATWCGPCREEMPELDAFYQAHKDSDAVVLGVNLEDVKRKTLEQFLKKIPVSYPILPDHASDSGPLGPIPGMPTTYVVSPQGEIAAWQVGGITRKLLENFLAAQNKPAPEPESNPAQ